jgi:P-type Ca2+ transporter type 2C
LLSVQFAFSSERKKMSTVVELSPGGPVRIYSTGGSDVILALSTHMLQASGISAEPTRVPLTPEAADGILAGAVLTMAKQSLRTVGLAYRDFESIAALPSSWETANAGIEEGMTFFGILGIKDPLRQVRRVVWNRELVAVFSADSADLLRSHGTRAGCS